MDILQQQGALFLGSRLKRLGERLQAGAARVISDAGLPVQPAHMPLLAALEASPLSVGELVRAVGGAQPGVTRALGQLAELGLVEASSGEDQRRRLQRLTPAGKAAMARAKLLVWPQVEAAVEALCGGEAEALLDQVSALEAALAANPLERLAAASRPTLLRVREYAPELAAEFHDINAEWITDMFQLEETDREVLRDPERFIIAPGGAILFVEAQGLGLVGACALQKTGERSFELTKMGVRESARGLKAGEFLLAAAIERAAQLGADPFYLLTSARCAAAIHLYEKLGFRHDAGIMARYGARYARCDVAMLYAPPPPPAQGGEAPTG